MWLDYDDKYAVSEDGFIKHKKTGRITHGFVDKGGYMRHTINNDNPTWRHVHRMIAERFLPRVNTCDIEVDHINGDKSDNRASNLRWCSRTINNQNRRFKLPPSGHKHIYLSRYQTFITNITKPWYYKSFKTLEEAITARDNFMRSIVDA